MTIGNIFDHTSGRLIPCGDAEIYVEEKGNPKLPVLLMLHGGFGSMEDFNAIAPAFGSQFMLVGIDSRGHGRSSLGDVKLSYKLLADDLAQVVDSLGLDEFSILGFSDGGIAAYRYAAGQDPRLRKIVTVGSSWEMSENEPAWEMISGMTGEIWKAAYPLSHENYMRLNPTPDFNLFAAAVLAMWTDLGPDGHPGPIMRGVTNEILLVRGDNDPLTSLESMAKLRSSLKNSSFLNIPFAGHTAFDDAPEVFLRSVDKFFGLVRTLKKG